MAPLRKRIPNYMLASVAVSLGGLAMGCDTGAIGAIMAMPAFAVSMGHLSATLVGFTVSLIMLTGAIPSVFAGYLADKYGRLQVVMLGGVLFGLGAAVQGAAYALPQFLAGRALTGLGAGAFLSNISVYICEVAPARHRGILAGLPQFMATAGICLGYFICYGTVRWGAGVSLAWRVPYVVQGVLSLALVAACLLLPESPRWYLLHGRRDEAHLALEKLDFAVVGEDRDFLTSTGQQVSLSLWQGLALLFRRGYRTRTTLALFILGMVQLSGIDGVLYYAPTLFAQAGLESETASFLASGLSAVLMLAVSVPAFLLADKWGRRTSAITGGVGLSGVMLLIGSLYAAGAVHPYGVARWVVIVSVYVFGLIYCSTWAIVGKIYASEIQPTHTRAAANCVAQGLGFFTNWVVAMLTPILLDKSAYGAYFLFGGLALGTVLVLAAYMPETRGRSLESIQEAFNSHAGSSPLLQRLRRRVGFANRETQQENHVELLDSEGGVVSSSGSTNTRGLRVQLASA
ncbi:general substrate transporter [Apiospora kogelbergensis]|uniref:General substrate transporter n=1 Tax=Apiospora kogelbergensis TaxID=1337665 RepID=A0AAW0R541_9PEZI